VRQSARKSSVQSRREQAVPANWLLDKTHEQATKNAPASANYLCRRLLAKLPAYTRSALASYKSKRKRRDLKFAGAKECQKILKRRLKITERTHTATDSAELQERTRPEFARIPIVSLDEGFHEFVNSVLKFPAASFSKRRLSKIRSMSRG